MSLRPAARVFALDRWHVATVGYAALAALCRPHTMPAAVAVVVAGLGLFVLGARRRATGVPPLRPPRPALVQWAAVVLLIAAWELVAFVWGNDADRPTLSLLLDPVLDTYPARFLGWVAWLLAGRWLVTR
jgi:hypothetical protein